MRALIAGLVVSAFVVTAVVIGGSAGAAPETEPAPANVVAPTGPPEGGIQW